MSEDQIVLLFCLTALITRIPRIVERWKAPLLHGPEWFFGVPVAADFAARGGGAILARYRLRLFVPWMIELPAAACMLLAGLNHGDLLYLVVGITLFTRLNYYAARNAAQKQARQSPAAIGTNAPAAIALSLQSRTLRDYTNPWIETAIVVLLGVSTACLAVSYAHSVDWHALEGLRNSTIFTLYLQAGLLLAKRAFVRARAVAPADGVEQYMIWRESLRRLCTSLCDYLRLGLAALLAFADVITFIAPQQSDRAKTIAVCAVLTAALITGIFEWRQRLRHLAVTKRTRPAEYFVRPDLTETSGIVCFRPSLPVLLLNSPRGYSLNLASSSAKIGGLYATGYAALWLLLSHLPS